MGCFFLWGCNDNYGLGEGWSSLQSIPNGHVFPSNDRGFQMFTPIDE
jgi:hypothetical protein